MQGHAAQKGLYRFLPRIICHLFTGCRQTSVLWDNVCLREAGKYISEAFRYIITPSSPSSSSCAAEEGNLMGEGHPAWGRGDGSCRGLFPSRQWTRAGVPPRNRKAAVLRDFVTDCLDPKMCDARYSHGTTDATQSRRECGKGVVVLSASQDGCPKNVHCHMGG